MTGNEHGDQGELPPGVAYLLQLAAAEDSGRGMIVDLQLGGYSAFTLIGVLQLALRHPGLDGTAAGQITRHVISVLRVPFRDTPADAVIDQGFNPESDS